MSSFTWNLRLSDPAPSKKADFDQYLLITNKKSTTLFPTSYRWIAYVTPNSPKGGWKSEFVVFVTKIQVQWSKDYYKVSLRENFQQQSCSITIPLSKGV